MHIDHFLNCVALWTPRWFNKPKFHILLRIIEHIQHFGPPLLFATKTFESYNALIQSLSVHSNRQALSRDIAIGFAKANRICHFSSGDKFFVKGKELTDNLIDANDKETEVQIPTHQDFRSVGEEVGKLISRQDQVFHSAFGGPQGRPEGKSGLFV